MKLHTFYQGIAAALVLPLLSTSDLKAEAPVTLTKIGTLDTGAGLSGAEITVYDPASQRLFVTSGSGFDIVDFSDPTNPAYISTVDPMTDGASDAAVTSVAVFDGVVAAAVPGADEQMPGSVFFYNAVTGAFIDSVVVGALPDMVTFSPDGQSVLVANEGEPDSGTTPFAGGYKIQITEIWSGQDGSDLTADWFEITNRGDAAWVQGVDPDLYYDDESADPIDAVIIAGLTQLDPGEVAIVVIGDSGDVTDFYNAWDPDKDLDSAEIGFADGGSGLADSGDAVTVWVDDPTMGGTIEDMEFYPVPTSGISWDVDLVEESTDGNDSGAVTTTATAGTSGTEPAVGSPGESSDGLEDPQGSISVIDVSGGFSSPPVTMIGFDAFDGMEDTLRAAGVRIFPFRFASADFEPEYIAVTPDGTTAFVALQENNAIAKIDLGTSTVTDILPLGLKDHSLPGNEIDPSNQDGGFNLANWPVFGMYMPDAIATVNIGGQDYFLTANEGDARDEDARIGSVMLDPTVFPDAATLQMDENLGRLNISTVDGDTDGDGDFDELFCYGARSFSIRDVNGNLVFDSGTTTEVEANNAGVNPDADRGDDKGTEPEGVTVGVIGGRTFAFVGLERADAVTVFDISNPAAATFEDIAFTIGVDDAPEGLVFISGSQSPTGGPLLVVSNEGDDEPATLAVYSIDVPAISTGSNSAEIGTLKKKIKKLKKKLKNAKRKQQAAKSKKFKHQIKKLKQQLRAL